MIIHQRELTYRDEKLKKVGRVPFNIFQFKSLNWWKKGETFP
jgi:hypothetical protein